MNLGLILTDSYVLLTQRSIGSDHSPVISLIWFGSTLPCFISFGRTCIAIVGANYCVIGGDMSMSKICNL